MEKTEFVYATFVRTPPEKLREALPGGESNILSAFTS